MGSSIGVIVGVVVLLSCLGLVVLMVVSEWSRSATAQGRPALSAPARSGRPEGARARKKALPKAKKSKK